MDVANVVVEGEFVDSECGSPNFCPAISDRFYWCDGVNLCGEFPLTAKPALSTHNDFMVPVFTADKSSVSGGRHQAVAVATNLTDALVPSMQ